MSKDSYTKVELERIRKVNTMRDKVRENPHIYKLGYFEGANLILMKKIKKKWVAYEETEAWFDCSDDWYWLQ